MDKQEQWKAEFDRMVEERGMMQYWPHFLPFMELLDSLPEKERMLEIGPYRGGSTRMFQILFRDVITIDPYPHEGFDADIRHPSRSREAVRELRERLNGSELDAVFIDADHSFIGVREDIVQYAPFVKDGGVIGFHDIGHMGVNPWTLMKEGSDRLLFEMQFKPPDRPDDYSYYGDPFVDLEFEVYDFEGLGAIRWRKAYEAEFEKSLYVYPLDLVVHRDWVDAEAFEKIREMNDTLVQQAEDTRKNIQMLVRRLEVRK